MGSDRARRSYNPSRQYRSVVQQQGRVVLEADLNEAQELSAEILRKEVIDIVGPYGTPDDGYRLSFPTPNPNRDFSVGAGTLFVGGQRLSVTQPISYFQQPDWSDGPDPVTNTPRELVYLQVNEEEISAVEDPDLREVALGGPDTAQRVRLLQRVRRFAVNSTTGAAAFTELTNAWSAQGLNFDPKTMALLSAARLLVSMVPATSTPTPCDPVAPEGFLGAENQLLRVQISASDRFLWAYDNASALYPAVITQTGTSATIRLLTTPVDTNHRPRTDQKVEILRAAAVLGDGNFAAAESGFVATIESPGYDPDTGTLVVSGTIPAAFTTSGAAGKPLFVRVWEQERSFVAGSAVELPGTGLRVTLSGAHFVVGDYWAFAARPTTPDTVYPRDYLTTPRPPEGPRRWAAPLSLVSWTTSGGSIDDLRPPFDDLVELTKRRGGGGCCTVTLRPEDLTGGTTLQSIIDQQRAQLQGGAKVSICLLPGTYLLPAPLQLSAEHSSITIEGCHDGAILQAAPGAEGKFLQGLVALTYADDVTFRNLRFHLPQVPFAESGGTLAGRPFAQLPFGVANLQGLRVSIGLRPAHCANLRVENCVFRFSLTQGQDVFGAGIFAASECWGLSVEKCRFLHKDSYQRVSHDPPRMLFGFLLAPSTTFQSSGSQVTGGTTVRSVLNDAVFRENTFSGLSAATLIYADVGLLKFEENTARECVHGFWVISLRSAMFDGNLSKTAITAVPSAQLLLNHPILLTGSALARAYAAPSGLQARHRGKPFNVSGTTNSLHSALLLVEQARYRSLEAQNPVLHLALHAADNDVEARVPDGPSGSALVLFGSERDPINSTILSANRLRNQGGGATVALLFARRCAASGNLIVNDSDSPNDAESQRTSLAVYSATGAGVGDGSAVTGNVFRGPTILPNRTVSANQPFATWAAFNSQLL